MATPRYTVRYHDTHTFGSTWAIYDSHEDDFVMYGPPGRLWTGRWMSREDAQAEADRLNAEVASCDAALWHGPGHQSKTRCRVTGPHETHETVYGADQQAATWTGPEATTGVFDEPPEGEG